MSLISGGEREEATPQMTQEGALQGEETVGAKGLRLGVSRPADCSGVRREGTRDGVREVAEHGGP